MPRIDGRTASQLRPVHMVVDYLRYAEGSALVEFGDTRVLCVASIEDRVPSFLEGRGQGWLTAEYSMLPRSGKSRSARESALGKTSGRTHEIQRLIGRSLRSCLNLPDLGTHTIILDCDVIQADGGTRTAAITGAWVALKRACSVFCKRGVLAVDPVQRQVAAVSVGLVEGAPLLDLNYAEDSHAEVDANIVMNDAGEFIEVQSTSEGKPFSRDQLDQLLRLAEGGIQELMVRQREWAAS
ncbi:MAG: ribonuclease PH [Ktedonobacterales bacterium]